MAQDFRSARFWAAELIETALCPGARAVDATMGNGHDTLWLCRQVGETGHVYAFDVQPEAVERTRALLDGEGVAERAFHAASGRVRGGDVRGVGGRLAPDVVERFRKLYPSYVTEKNEVVISNQEFRDAPKNRQACFNKLCAAILAASKRPKKRIPTKPTPGSIERRLDAKKRLSAKKKDRSKKDFD